MKGNLLHFIYLILVTLLLAGCRTPQTDNDLETDAYGSFTMETTYSFGNKYYAVQEAVKYEDGQWRRDDSAERPDDIISKYD